MPNIIRLLMLGLFACPSIGAIPGRRLWHCAAPWSRPTASSKTGPSLSGKARSSAVGAKVKLPANATAIDTHGIIAPGLIDLHNHLTYNVFPRWHPTEEFGNRYDWQQKPIYQTLDRVPA